MARQVSMFVAGGYMSDKGSENPAIAQAGKLAYDDVEAAGLGSGVSTSPSSPEDVAGKNGNGSFERFMLLNGQLNQRGKMI